MLTSMANIPVQTNIWDQDQTAPMRSGSILVASTTSFNNELVDDIWVVMYLHKCSTLLGISSLAIKIAHKLQTCFKRQLW